MGYEESPWIFKGRWGWQARWVCVADVYHVSPNGWLVEHARRYEFLRHLPTLWLTSRRALFQLQLVKVSEVSLAEPRISRWFTSLGL